MSTEARLCQRCNQPISAERLEEVPVARLCLACLRPRPCEICKRMISLDRIDAVPETRLCAECSKQTGGDTTLKCTTSNTGKAGSLKQTGTTIDSTAIVRRKVPRKQE
jgi:Prokaryotic dksA/traR C4-type zinc finger